MNSFYAVMVVITAFLVYFSLKKGPGGDQPLNPLHYMFIALASAFWPLLVLWVIIEISFNYFYAEEVAEENVVDKRE